MKRPNGVGDLQKGERCVFVICCQPAKYDAQSIGSLDILTWIISFSWVLLLQWYASWLCPMTLPVNGAKIFGLGCNPTFLIHGQLILERRKSASWYRSSTSQLTLLGVTIFSLLITLRVLAEPKERPLSVVGQTLIVLPTALGRWVLDLGKIPSKITWVIWTGKRLLRWVTQKTFAWPLF